MDRVKTPLYWGGMILSDVAAAYQYEMWLSSLIKRRYDAIIKKHGHGFLVTMNDVFKERVKRGMYGVGCLYPIPDDPLVVFDEESAYWPVLRLNRVKLNIVKLEVFKLFRRVRHQFSRDVHKRRAELVRERGQQ